MTSIQVNNIEAIFELLNDLRRMGNRVTEAIEDMQRNVEVAQKSLDDGNPPFMARQITDNPIQLLRDMEPVQTILGKLGVPAETIAKARRGEFVSALDLGLSREELQAAFDAS